MTNETRITIGVVSETVGVLVKDHVTSVVDKLASTGSSVEGNEKVGTVNLIVSTHDLLDVNSRLVSIVERNSSDEVVADVGLDDSVENVLADPSKVSIDGCRSTSGIVPFTLSVVWKSWIGVLQESDHDQVVVDNEVWQAVVENDSSQAKSLVSKIQTKRREHESKVGQGDLDSLLRLEQRREGPEVVDLLGRVTLVFLTGDIEEEISGPSTNLLDEQCPGSRKWSLLNELHKLGFVLVLIYTSWCLNRVIGWVSSLGSNLGRSCLWHKDHVLGQVTGHLVVSSMRELPRKVWYQES